jgi:hypothetical protein
MGNVIQLKKVQARKRSKTGLRESFKWMKPPETEMQDDQVVTKKFPMRWGWTLSIWVSVLLIFNAAINESALWVCIHAAFGYWALGVRRNNDAVMGGSKHW